MESPSPNDGPRGGMVLAPERPGSLVLNSDKGQVNCMALSVKEKKLTNEQQHELRDKLLAILSMYTSHEVWNYCLHRAYIQTME